MDELEKQTYEVIFKKIMNGETCMQEVEFDDPKERKDFFNLAGKYFHENNADMVKIWKREIEYYCNSIITDDDYCGMHGYRGECGISSIMRYMRRKHIKESLDDDLEHYGYQSSSSNRFHHPWYRE